MKKITYKDFARLLCDQFPGEDTPEQHLAVVCPSCGTVQSETSFTRAEVDEETIYRVLGFSCIGRYTDAIEAQVGEKTGRGCSYTLGGLFKLHTLVVVKEDGEERPSFEPAAPAQAQELRLLHQRDPDAITIRSRRSPDGRFFFSKA